MKKLTRDRVVPIISARVTWVIFDLRDQSLRFARLSKFRHRRGCRQVTSHSSGYRFFSNKAACAEKG
jgi:hypothetical protein